VGHAEWSFALWPGRPVSPATVYSTASDVRRALGRDRRGVEYVSRGHQLSVRSGVRTDVEHFAELARSQPLEGGCRALALVRGPVLAGLRRADWALFDGTKAGIEALLVRTARRTTELLLQDGKPDEAEWAVRRGLAACPYDERLYRALLRTTAAQGNRARLPVTLAELVAMAAGDESPGPRGFRRSSTRASPDCLHPSTTALYRDLLSGVAATGGHPARL
jgi:DNA-binding SARP family transcriptional activator